eukprot:2842910-Prymnesium_polylepis.1
MLQHAAPIARNGEGLSPRDYARLGPIHDLLKVEELRQGFELQWDYVFECSYETVCAGGEGARLGVPKPGEVSTKAIKAELDQREAEDTKASRAATAIQKQMRGKLIRKMKLQAEQGRRRTMSHAQRVHRQATVMMTELKKHILG